MRRLVPIVLAALSAALLAGTADAASGAQVPSFSLKRIQANAGDLSYLPTRLPFGYRYERWQRPTGKLVVTFKHKRLRRPLHVPGRARPAGHGVGDLPGLVPPDPAAGREQGLLRRLGRRVDRLALRHLTEDAPRLPAQRPLERPAPPMSPSRASRPPASASPARRTGLRTPQKGFRAIGVGAPPQEEDAMARARATTILSLALALVALGRVRARVDPRRPRRRLRSGRT